MTFPQVTFNFPCPVAVTDEIVGIAGAVVPDFTSAGSEVPPSFTAQIPYQYFVLSFSVVSLSTYVVSVTVVK